MRLKKARPAARETTYVLTKRNSLSVARTKEQEGEEANSIRPVGRENKRI